MTNTLRGLRVLNTRPKHQAQELSLGIQEAGGIVIECPTLEILETSHKWVTTLPKLQEVHQALFISANAVHYCFKALTEHNLYWPQHIQVIAIGQASAKALECYKIQTHAMPQIPDSEHLLELPSLQQINNQNVLLFKGEGGRPTIEETLRLRGAHLVSVSVYQRLMPTIDQNLLHSLWQDNLVDIILITSEQSLHHLFKLFGKEAHAWLQSKTYVLFSQRLADAALKYGITRIKISHPERMMHTLFDTVQGLTDDS